ncbi:MAG TPA: glycoside hydrolase family 97 C-terminal domain-containing protein, partial [Caproiciproducens sp.]|nr:glycoside hydrolase family 97 C-terminal domain-containing protein [Caproiciproducens sp.]
MPAAWEDTKLLDADLGKYVAEARKSKAADIANGAAEWYASAICTDARNATFNLNFLTSGKAYYAWIYQDGYTNDDALVSCKQVTSTDTLTVPMNKNGGCNVKFTTSKPSDSTSITLDKTSATLEEGKNVTLTATLSDEKTDIEYNSVNWTSSNTNVATVSSTGKVTAVGVGSAVITAATGVTGSVKATCAVTVKAAAYGLADNWTVANNNASNFILNSENSLTLLTEDGNWKPMGGDSSDKNITTTETSGDFTIITDMNYTSSTKSLPAGLIVYDKNGTSSSSGGGFGPGGGSSSKPHVALLRGTTTTTTTSNANDANGVNVTTQNTATQKTIKLTDGTNSIIVEDQLADTPNVYLKIQRIGNVYTGFYSKDKVTWIPVTTDSASSITNTDVEDTTGVGVETANGSGRYENIAAVFSNFTLNDTKVAFAKSLGTNSDSDSDSDSDSSSSSSSTTASTGTSIVTTQDPNGGVTATIPTQPDAAPVVSGNHSVMNVTVSSDVASILSAATAANRAEVRISAPTSAILEQLQNTAVQAVDLTIRVPAAVVNNTNANAKVNIGLEPTVLQAAKNAKKDVTIEVVDSQTGNAAYTWTFSGANLNNSAASLTNVNLAITVAPAANDTAAATVTAANTSDKKAAGIVLNFANSGVLPAPATVKVYVGNQAGGTPFSKLYLYYINSATKALEQLTQSEYTVDAFGYVTVSIARCSSYVLLSKPATNAYPVKSDTSSTVGVKNGKTYTYAMTVSGKAVPSFTAGNSKAFATTVKRAGNKYYVTVKAVGAAGAMTAVYSTLPGQKPVVMDYIAIIK